MFGRATITLGIGPHSSEIFLVPLNRLRRIHMEDMFEGHCVLLYIVCMHRFVTW